MVNGECLLIPLLVDLADHFLSGMNPKTSSRNCTLQQSSVNADHLGALLPCILTPNWMLAKVRSIAATCFCIGCPRANAFVEGLVTEK